MIDASTRLYCIFGNPVRHSFSPAMQNAAFSGKGIDAVYTAFEVADIGAAIAAMRTLGIAGASVTIPHKIEAVKYVDEIEDIAEHIGSINTLINRDGKIAGTNTDAYGFFKALSEKTVVDGKSAAVFGSGGASRAVCFSLFHYAKPERLTLFVRGDDKPESDRLRERLIDKLGLEEFRVSSKLLTVWPAEAGDFDILVNTTPLGMHPNESAIVIDESTIPAGRTVMDLVYNPVRTRFIAAAEAKGCTIAYGLDMLLYQGVRQFELWTGTQAPLETMRKVLVSKIGG